jgi:hypothetical protein
MTMAFSVDDDHDIVSVSSKPFSSLPLFLPSDVEYDPETNAVTASKADIPGVEAPVASHLVLVPDAGLDMLQNMKPKNAPISIISCVGPYRTGKSLLVSRFLKNSNAFQIGPTLEGCTRGIWISTSVLKQKSTGTYKFVLDCEGMGDPLSASGADSTVSNDARIALACVLLSTVFLFNNTSHPDRGSLNFLRYLDAVRKRIPLAKSRVKYPSFLWVFRDFFLQLPPKPDDPTQKYTLEEYMLERVLNQKHNSDDAQIVNSLLEDFASFNVMSICYPKQQQGQPFGIDEMATLGDVPWDAFDDSFRSEMNAVIQHCLIRAATPFSFADESTKSKKWKWSPRSAKGSYATGSVYAKWCETVTELVNSEGVIPNIPDLQHQLLQSIADEQLEKCIETYQKEMSGFLEACDVYNGDSKQSLITNIGSSDKTISDLLLSAADIDFELLVANKLLVGVADADDVIGTSIVISERLIAELTESISSSLILSETLELFHSKCSDESKNASFLAQLQQKNYNRSQKACEVLAQSLYLPIRSAIREDPTKVNVSDFKTLILTEVETFFGSCARGPAMEETLMQFIKEPGEADAIFLASVQEKQSLLDSALEKEVSLRKDIEKTQNHLKDLEKDFNEAREKNRKELEKMKADHTAAMEKTLIEQKLREEAQLAALEMDMQAKLNKAEETLSKKEMQRLSDIDALKEEAKSRLLSEVSVREERMKNEQMAYEAELAHMRAVADERMKSELDIAEQRRIAEQLRITEEMKSKLKEAEDQMQRQIRQKQETLLLAEQAMARKNKENDLLLQRAELAESQACPAFCCCM